MQIAATFIEYLTSGCTALLWLLPLLSVSQSNLLTLSPAHVALMIPVVFVIGHLVDFLSYHAVKLFKPLVWKNVYKGAGNNAPEKESDTIRIILASPELAKENQMRSSRDRIARGAFFNSICLMLVVSFRLNELKLPFSPIVSISALSSIIIICFGTWWEFEKRTKQFRKDAIQVINRIDKEKREEASKGKTDA